MRLGGAGAHPEWIDLERRIESLGIGLGLPVHHFESLDSTSDRAKEGAREGAPHGSLYLAETQTKGRGRQGRAWVSPPHENLLFSVLLRFHRPVHTLATLPLVAGLSVTECVAKAVTGVGSQVRMKWPNDVLVDGSKIAGILVETVGPAASPVVILGIGLNVHTRTFPAGLNATSIALHRGAPPDRGELLLSLLSSLDRDVFLAAGRGLGPFSARLRAVDYLLGREVRSDSGSVGIAEGIDVDGRLMVRTREGTKERWAAGEVHLGSAQSPGSGG